MQKADAGQVDSALHGFSHGALPVVGYSCKEYCAKAALDARIRGTSMSDPELKVEILVQAVSEWLSTDLPSWSTRDSLSVRASSC